MQVEAWLTRAARVAPERIALQTPCGRWSYRELCTAASAGATNLYDLGARPGERVAIALPAGFEFVQALHACLLLGAVAVPVDVRLAAAERERIAAGAAVVVEAPLAGGVTSHAPNGAAQAPDDALFAQAVGSGGRLMSPSPTPRHDLDATAVVIHTSGTTAAPRPVELSYGNLLWSALGSAVALGLDPQERWLCALPPSHVGGLSILVRSAIYATTAVVHERFEVERALHALREEDVTLVSLVATTLSRLLDAGLREPPTLRCALTGGGPVPGALLQRARETGVPVGLTYGLTETGSQVTTTPAAEIAPSGTSVPADGPRSRSAPVRACAGPPLFCTQVRIAADGEILVRGPTVARSAARDEDGWLHTGDVGSLDERGRLRVAGRKSDTIISGGENVAPAEVEAVLESHPLVAEAAVLGRSDPEWGEAVTAIVVARSDERAPDPAELRAHCARALAAYKVPKDIAVRSEPLPRTGSGKLLRRELTRA